MLSDVGLGVSDSMLKVETVRFDDIQTVFTADRNKIHISKGVLKGPQLDGEVSGNIYLETPLERSRLHLKGHVKPHASFISKLNNTLPVDLLIRNKSGKKGFPVSINGTVKAPGVSLR